MNKIIFATALTGMLIPTVAFAELSYNSVSAAYAKTSESGYADLNEFDIGISKSLTKNLYITGSYATGSQATATGQGDITLNGFSIGLGYHTPIKRNVDFIFLGGFGTATASLGSISITSNGYQIGVAIRGELSPHLESTISGIHTNTTANSLTTTSNGMEVELGFNITQELQLFGGIGSTSHSPQSGASYTDQTVAFGLHYFY